VAVAPVSSATELVTQQVFFVDHAGQAQTSLQDLLKRPEVTRTLVFTRTKHGANRVVEHLEKAGIHAQAIHGNKSQNARSARSTASATAAPRCWWPPTSPRAAST
jgi:ATP-dependent RNA helicase RhlE